MKKRLQEMEQETMALHPKDEGAAAGDGTKKADGAKVENGDEAAAASGKVDAEGGTLGIAIDEATADSDGRSIYVGNVSVLHTSILTIQSLRHRNPVCILTNCANSIMYLLMAGL